MFLFLSVWLTNVVCVPWCSIIKILKSLVYGKKKKSFLDPTRRDLVEPHVRDICFMYIYHAALFLHNELCLGLMDQIHTKTSTSSLQMGPTQVPPTLWLTTTNYRKFCVHSPLACYWELNQRPLLLLESLRFRERQNVTVSLKILVPFDHLLHIWRVIRFKTTEANMVSVPNWCSFPLISISSLVIPLK